MHSNSVLSRRQMLQLGVSAAGIGVVAASLPRLAHAEDLLRLTEADPTAAALGYREDPAKVGAIKYPTHKAGQHCANCKLFAGTDKSASATCQLFPGKSVAAKGWCSAYNAKA